MLVRNLVIPGISVCALEDRTQPIDVLDFGWTTETVFGHDQFKVRQIVLVHDHVHSAQHDRHVVCFLLSSRIMPVIREPGVPVAPVATTRWLATGGPLQRAAAEVRRHRQGQQGEH